jgi:hypothetical protein
MDQPGVLWIGVVVAVLVFLDLLFVELRRVYREAKRIFTRLEAYAELPILSLLAASEHDVERITGAIDAVTPLVERGQVAVAVLRRYMPKGSSPG